jgi:hypothetical protein
MTNDTKNFVVQDCKWPFIALKDSTVSFRIFAEGVSNKYFRGFSVEEYNRRKQRKYAMSIVQNIDTFVELNERSAKKQKKLRTAAVLQKQK